MLIPCEVTVKFVVPVIRALVAKELTQEYGLRQEETGNLLGVTQAAISQYLKRTRGKALDLAKDAEIGDSIKEIAAMLYSKNASHQDFIAKICNVCETVRRKGLMCALHRRLEQSLTTEQCRVCLP